MLVGGTDIDSALVRGYTERKARVRLVLIYWLDNYVSSSLSPLEEFVSAR